MEKEIYSCTHSSGGRADAEDGLMKLCVLNSTVCGHFSLSRLLMRDTALLDPTPAEVQIFKTL